MVVVTSCEMVYTQSWFWQVKNMALFIIFQIDVDGPEDTSLDEILSVMDEIQKELMDEGQNSW